MALKIKSKFSKDKAVLIILTFLCFDSLCVLQSTEMPVELMELIISKSVVSLHAVYRIRLHPRGDLLTMTTLMSVCQQWRHILSTQRNQHRLKDYFKQSVCFVTNLINSTYYLLAFCLTVVSPFVLLKPPFVPVIFRPMPVL